MSNILALIQKLVAADKTVLAAVVVQAVVALVAGLGLHLNGTAVGIVSALVAAGLGYFIHANFKAKLAAAAK